MGAATVKKLMTTEELLAMPDDGVRRWLIRGVLHEEAPDAEGGDVTIRNRFHSRVLIRTGYLLERWAEAQPEPRGQVVGGEAGFILRREPDTTAGLDVAYVSPDTVAVQTDETTLFDGPPVLAVEILSPSNTHRAIVAKVRDYFAAGVRVVWVVDPDDRTIKVSKSGQPPVLFNETQTLSGDPELPGFAAPVADFFR